MIDQLIKDANIVETPTIKGVSNVIQACTESDVLLLPVNSFEQQEDLIAKNLPKDFKGLLISPFKTNKKINQIVKSKEEIKEIEKELTEEFYPLPKNLPKIVGVTGTNGKTSVCWLTAELARENGKKALYAGTPGVFLNGTPMPEKVLTTTPSYLSFRKLISTYSDIDLITIEVSSHALEQKRVEGIHLDVAVWTNFTQDHLDFHKTMENYFNAKLKIINYTKGNDLIVHPCEKELVEKLGSNNYALAEVVSDELLPSVFKTGFPRLNLELAITAFKNCDFDLKNLNLDSISLPPGRFQVLEKNGKTFIVDYAHTSDALKSVLAQVRDSYPDKEILTVFGCGGDRDRKKRPLMAAAAEEGSDFVIVTSDNPRTEDPNQIIEDILKGLRKNDHSVEVDRKKAIELSNSKTDGDWVIVIAGKGHETYQEVNGIRHPFDDTEVVRGL